MNRRGAVSAAAFGFTLAAVSAVTMATIGGTVGIVAALAEVFVAGYGMGAYDGHADRRGGRLLTRGREIASNVWESLTRRGRGAHEREGA